MKLIIVETTSYEQGKLIITFWVRIKLTNWREHLKSFFNPNYFDIFDGKGIDCFNTLKEAKKCKKLYEEGKWNGMDYSKVVG